MSGKMTGLEAVVGAVINDGLGGKGFVGHILSEEGRPTLAAMAAVALSERIRNDKLAAVAGDTLARVLNGERVSGKDVFRTAFALWATRKGTF